MKLKIITPDNIVFNGEVKKVNLPGSYGYFSVLENHAPFITTLKKGTLSYLTKQDEIAIEVEAGFVEVNNNIVTVCLEIINEQI
jgi:F-type H+-transporting ATPase subunit epsilon